jgi:hypothetical protein
MIGEVVINLNMLVLLDSFGLEVPSAEQPI